MHDGQQNPLTEKYRGESGELDVERILADLQALEKSHGELRKKLGSAQKSKPLTFDDLKEELGELDGE